MLKFAWNYYDSGYDAAGDWNLRAYFGPEFVALCDETIQDNDISSIEHEFSSEEAEDSGIIESENIDGTEADYQNEYEDGHQKEERKIVDINEKSEQLSSNASNKRSGILASFEVIA